MIHRIPNCGFARSYLIEERDGPMIVDVGSISAAQEIENYCLNNLGRSLQGYQANRRYPFLHRSYRWDRYLPYEDRISYIGSGLLSRYDLAFENWGIITTSGHTEDSVSFFNEDTRELICGDLILGRKDGTGADDFAKNSLIYRCALQYYLENGFTYIKLGDAEELWENDNFDQIYITHTPVYEFLAKFHDPDPEKTRYLKVWGNHDLYWKDSQTVYQSLFPGIQIYEGIILLVPVRVNDHILMLHGHQADPRCCGEIATISKFFVHNFWTGFQRIGAKDPTRAATNPGLCNEVDDRLHEWATHNDQGITTIIAGHTHRAVFENLSITERRYRESKVKTEIIKITHEPDTSYFNSGSCVHPQGITGIEILFNGDFKIMLVEWLYAVEGNALTIQRYQIAGAVS
ncbi:MAG: hypothetical protein WA121_12630 [Syntrophales bacterium]